MDELVNQLTSRLGLPEDVARQAVEIILNELKGRLPGPVAGQIDGLLSGGKGLDDLGKAAGGLGGLFGRK